MADPLNRWSTTPFSVSQMTPIWIFPCYPLLVIGPHAGVLASHLANYPTADRDLNALQIILGGFIFQGIGFMLSMMIYGAWIYRLMTQKLPEENLRPGMFVSVGPSGFTVAGIVSMGQTLPRVVPASFFGGEGVFAGRVSLILSVWVGLWLWGLAVWFFLISVGAHWSCFSRKGRSMPFAMTFYSYVFPNTALTTATFAVGGALNTNGINILGCIMTVALVLTWIVVFVAMIRAVWNRDIMWPQKGEDKNEEQRRPGDGRWGIHVHHGHDSNRGSQ